MDLDDVESVWTTLLPPQSPAGVNGRRAAGLPRNPVYIAVDGQRRRHLLIQVPEDTTPINHRDTRSLEVITGRFQVGSGPEALYLDLVCADSSQYPTFSSVAVDLLRSLGSSPTSVRDSVFNSLARWRTFWSNKASSMSQEDALGLFGELWFMRRWLAPVTAGTIAHWQATDSARHDFQWDATSVEVKTAAVRTAGEPVHRISSLEQLADPERGSLYLFSLQVCDDALAANTLSILIEGLASELATNFEALAFLNGKLAKRGYSPLDRQVSARPLRILAERLYRVSSGFPRIVRSTFSPDGLPEGVRDVGYSIDLAVCRQWLVATTPTESAALFLRQV